MASTFSTSVIICIIICTTCSMYSLEENKNVIRQNNIAELRKVKETNVFNFLRLVVFRMVYGFLSMLGFGEPLENFAGGVLVPPGVDSDYAGLDYNDDDYKEDYNDNDYNNY